MNDFLSLVYGFFKEQGLSISSGTRPFIFYWCAVGEANVVQVIVWWMSILQIYCTYGYAYHIHMCVCVLFKTGGLGWIGRGNVCPPKFPLTSTDEEGFWTLNTYTHLMVVSRPGFLLLMPVILILRNPPSIVFYPCHLWGFHGFILSVVHQILHILLCH